MILIKIRIAKEAQGLVKGYARITSLTRQLEATYQHNDWYRLPLSKDEGQSAWIPLADNDRFLRKTARDMGASAEQWPQLGMRFSTLITTASGLGAWDDPEKTVIDYAPGGGLVLVKIHTAISEHRWPFTRVRDLLVAGCSELDASFACCDYPRAPRPCGKSGETYYGTDHRVFPHREFFGWMGFVRRRVTHDQVPEADEVIPLPQGAGTVIVAVANVFDVHNPAHIEKAQRVEMRLVDLDALPVTDPRRL
jgi:hypothetical protein